MIKVDGHTMSQEAFGDGTLKCEEAFVAGETEVVHIVWLYDNDAELFCLWSLARQLKNRYPDKKFILTIPYIPHARQDRRVSGKLFTLKYFAELINKMDFYKVYVLDPHSDVSLALIDRVDLMFTTFVPVAREDVKSKYGKFRTMYPDAGAAKRYASLEGVENPIIGDKRRGENGRVSSFELLNFEDGTETVLIRDDICSYGGTFVAAAKALKERGVKNVALLITHCENNITKGEVFDWIDDVYTTDTICTVTHPKLHIIKNFRG